MSLTLKAPILNVVQQHAPEHKQHQRSARGKVPKVGGWDDRSGTPRVSGGCVIRHGSTHMRGATAWTHSKHCGKSGGWHTTRKRGKAMTITQVVNARKGCAGSQGSWCVYKQNDMVSLYHYSTLMLRWRDTGYGVEVLYIGTGHGSVSDQGGMNRAFRALGLNYRFARAGGARVVDLTTGEEVA